MRLLKQSTAYNLTVFMTDSADHVAGKTGLTLTITASKDGAAFGSITPTVTELANGWYKLALTTSHTDTVGDLALHITATGADATDLAMQVRANVLGDTLAVNAIQISGDSAAADAVEAAFDGSGIAEPTAKPAWATATLTSLVAFLAALARNKMTQTSTATALRNDADSADITTWQTASNGTTYTREEAA